MNYNDTRMDRTVAENASEFSALVAAAAAAKAAERAEALMRGSV